MSSPSPLPPYSLQPPPYTRRKRKQHREPSPPGSPRISSREMLKEALKCARRAVKLDSATKVSSTSSKLGSDSVRPDLTAAVAAYDEAIAILQRVIARRSQKPGIATGEVERVTDIHDRYAERVRELCRNHGIALPSHVARTRGGFTPSMITSPLPSLADDPPRSSSPDTPQPTRDTKLSLNSNSHSHSSPSRDDETESESEPPLTPSSSTPETPLPTSPTDDDYVLKDRRWILSAACDEDVKEWGQCLGEAAANRLSSAPTSSAVWRTMARSDGECVP